MRKSNLKQFTTIKNGSMTGTSVITSSVTAVTILDNVGFQFDWSGSPVGSFQVQVSANYNQDEIGNVLNPGTWVPITFEYFNGSTMVTAISIPTSAGSPIFLDITQISAPFIRAVYTNASGTGTLNAIVCAKMV